MATPKGTCTMDGDAVARDAALAAGFDCHITTPINMEQLDLALALLPST